MNNITTTLFLQNYEVNVSIGIHDFEKIAKQRIIISEEIKVSNSLASNDDNIEKVLDYDFLRREINQLIEDRHFNLQETLCRSILDLIKIRPEVKSAYVSVHKPDVYQNCEGVGVRMKYTS